MKITSRFYDFLIDSIFSAIWISDLLQFERWHSVHLLLLNVYWIVFKRNQEYWSANVENDSDTTILDNKKQFSPILIQGKNSVYSLAAHIWYLHRKLRIAISYSVLLWKILENQKWRPSLNNSWRTENSY